MKKTALLCFYLILTQLILAQNWTVSGVVTAAEDGYPLIGVNVIVKGVTGTGTITDLNGSYTIKVPQGKSLSFSYIGYKEQIKEIKSNTVLNIIMEADAKMLDEVVAIGYGTMKKSDLTGAVTSIGADKIKQLLTVRTTRGLMHHWRTVGPDIPCRVASPQRSTPFLRAIPLGGK
jgi:hypothetical protein